MVGGGISGQILGGLIPRWGKMKVRGMLISSVVVGYSGTALCLCLLLHCPSTAMAGVDRPYTNRYDPVQR